MEKKLGNQCMFKYILSQCKKEIYASEILSEERKIKVIDSSIKRLDNYHERLKSYEPPLLYHSNCYLANISSDHINRHLNYLKRNNTDSIENKVAAKRTTRSSLRAFDFKTHCFFCGDVFKIEPDK